MSRAWCKHCDGKGVMVKNYDKSFCQMCQEGESILQDGTFSGSDIPMLPLWYLMDASPEQRLQVIWMVGVFTGRAIKKLRERVEKLEESYEQVKEDEEEGQAAVKGDRQATRADTKDQAR